MSACCCATNSKKRQRNENRTTPPCLRRPAFASKPRDVHGEGRGGREDFCFQTTRDPESFVVCSRANHTRPPSRYSLSPRSSLAIWRRKMMATKAVDLSGREGADPQAMHVRAHPHAKSINLSLPPQFEKSRKAVTVEWLLGWAYAPAPASRFVGARVAPRPIRQICRMRFAGWQPGVRGSLLAIEPIRAACAFRLCSGAFSTRCNTLHLQHAAPATTSCCGGRCDA